MDEYASQLVVEHLPLALRIASRSYFPDDPDLEKSIALEALCEAAIKFPGGNFQGWLATMIRNRIADEQRRRYGRNGQHPAGFPLYEDDLPPIEENPAAEAGEREYIAQLLRSLPTRHRQIAVLRAHGLTQEEVGVRLGVTHSRICQIEREMQRSMSRKRSYASL